MVQYQELEKEPVEEKPAKPVKSKPAPSVTKPEPEVTELRAVFYILTLA